MKLFFLLSFIILTLLPFDSCAKPRGVVKPGEGRATKTEAFCFGLVTGVIPIVGQAVAALACVLGNSKREREDYINDACFVTGHVMGMTVWALPWYLVYRHYYHASSESC